MLAFSGIPTVTALLNRLSFGSLAADVVDQRPRQHIRGPEGFLLYGPPECLIGNGEFHGSRTGLGRILSRTEKFSIGTFDYGFILVLRRVVWRITVIVLDRTAASDDAAA